LVNKDFSFKLTAENKTIKTEAVFSGKMIKSLPVIEKFGGTNLHYMGNAKPAFLNWKVSEAKYTIIDKSPPTVKMKNEVG